MAFFLGLNPPIHLANHQDTEETGLAQDGFKIVCAAYCKKDWFLSNSVFTFKKPTRNMKKRNGKEIFELPIKFQSTAT